jgi:hypothetical protein
MSCPICGSKQEEFLIEMVVHPRGLKNVGNPGILVVQKVFVCPECGLSQFTVPKAELALLTATAPNGRHWTAEAS